MQSPWALLRDWQARRREREEPHGSYLIFVSYYIFTAPVLLQSESFLLVSVQNGCYGFFI